MRARKYRLVFVDQLLATHVHLRHGVTHDVLGACFGVDCSIITRASTRSDHWCS
ncbi:transposase family protein [Actinokineospora sp. 24-640]